MSCRVCVCMCGWVAVRVCVHVLVYYVYPRVWIKSQNTGGSNSPTTTTLVREAHAAAGVVQDGACTFPPATQSMAAPCAVPMTLSLTKSRQRLYSSARHIQFYSWGCVGCVYTQVDEHSSTTNAATMSGPHRKARRVRVVSSGGGGRGSACKPRLLPPSSSPRKRVRT
jgi:hypothetical protein